MQKTKELTVFDTLAKMSEVHGTFAVAEVEAMIKTVKTLKKNPVAVVLGSGPGTATIAMLAARPDIKVFSIDIDVARTELLHAKQWGYVDRLTQIQGNSYLVPWNNPQVDLLFVDACHAYSCVKRDNAAWLPRLKDGGIAWYHDYGENDGMWLQVKAAVDEDLSGQEKILNVCSSIAFRWNPSQWKKLQLENKGDV